MPPFWHRLLPNGQVVHFDDLVLGEESGEGKQEKEGGCKVSERKTWHTVVIGSGK